MNQYYQNLVFKGSGVKGAAYAGAISALEERGILKYLKTHCRHIDRSNYNWLLAVGYTAAKIDLIVRKEMDFESFMDKTSFPFSKIVRLLKKYGWYKGDTFIEGYGKKIKTKQVFHKQTSMI